MSWLSISIIEIVLFIIFFIFLITLFQNGKRLSELREIGQHIITCIDNNKLPENISVLKSCLKPEEFQLALNIAKYNYLNKDSLNVPYKNLVDKPYKEDIFSLTSYEDFMGFYYLSYKYKEKKFIYSDE